MIADKRLLENQYCVGSLPVNYGFGYGVGSLLVEILANGLYFRYLIYGNISAENVNSSLPFILGVFIGS